MGISLFNLAFFFQLSYFTFKFYRIVTIQVLTWIRQGKDHQQEAAAVRRFCLSLPKSYLRLDIGTKWIEIYLLEAVLI